MDATRGEEGRLRPARPSVGISTSARSSREPIRAHDLPMLSSVHGRSASSGRQPNGRRDTVGVGLLLSVCEQPPREAVRGVVLLVQRGSGRRWRSGVIRIYRSHIPGSMPAEGGGTELGIGKTWRGKARLHLEVVPPARPEHQRRGAEAGGSTPRERQPGPLAGHHGSARENAERHPVSLQCRQR